jgi:hypothetical protein
MVLLPVIFQLLKDGGGGGLTGRLVEEERAGEGENFSDVGRGGGLVRKYDQRDTGYD